MANVKVPYLAMRDGRPRWVPSPQLRALGYKGRDLKDSAGRWLSEGDAISEAQRLNEAVKAAGSSPALAPAAHDHSVRAMVTAFLKRPKISLDEATAAVPGKKKLARSSRLAYHNHGALLIEWVGDFAAGDITPAMIEGFYDDRIADSGVRTANAIVASFKAFFYYAERKLRWGDVRNPVVGLEMDQPGGRLVIWPRAEIACYVAVADYLGWPSLGDAVILALVTTQRRNDLLPLRPGALDAQDIYRFKTSKTRREAKAKAVPMLLDRIRAMRARKTARWGAAGAHQDFEIVCEATGAGYPADGSYFFKRFAAVKLIAAGGNGSNSDMEDAMKLLGVSDARLAAMPIARMPSLNNLWFRDLRDTAITWLAAAGCNDAEIATVTGLSLASVKAILDKHYLVREDAFAISAGDRLAAYLGRSG